MALATAVTAWRFTGTESCTSDNTSSFVLVVQSGTLASGAALSARLRRRGRLPGAIAIAVVIGLAWFAAAGFVSAAVGFGHCFYD
jgi:hypothetical protein